VAFSSQKRNLLILIALVGAWGLLLVFRSPAKTPTAPPGSGRPGTAARTPPAQGGGLTRLKTELLNLPQVAYTPEVQNIFGSPPPPPPPRPPEALPAAPPAPPPPDPFQEEAKRLRYVGFLQAGKTALAFIVSGAEVHTLEVGATLGGRFRVEAITEDAVVLTSFAGDKQVRLPLAAETGPPVKR
jgi:hypothetical protein